ncbi:MAG: FHA domain-containing protein [Butyricicoccus pullicaecorum]|nr:FHA domain-containing protein [Butyricicoccus pullicaecorum]
MLKFIIGALVIVLIIWLIARRRSHKSKKPFPQRLIDWLLARELAEEKPQKRASRPAQAAHHPSTPRRTKPDADQTAYIRPTRRPPQATEITLCYSNEIDGNARYVPVDHLPLCVGARSDCDCVIDNDTISRQHFEIFRDAYGEVSVRNLSRTNGIVPIDEQTGNLEEPILQPGVVIPIDRDTGTLRFWAGELFFTLRLQAANSYR